MSTPKPITALLTAAGQGDAGAQDQLWALVYDELHALAQRQAAGEPPGRSPQATTLVQMAYVRLTGPDGQHLPWANRRHFFAAAAESMRRILVDGARTRRRLKRGGGNRPGELAEEPGVRDTDPAEILAVHEALDRLAERAPRKAEIVKLRYFAGLSIDETAEALGISPRTVDYEWRYARAWLHRELSAGEPETE